MHCWKAESTYRNQKRDGSWGEVYSTAFSMLFLMNARRPAIFGKLSYNGDWNNRPRDLAMLNRWMPRWYCLGQLSWHVVNFKMPVRDWQDSPILLITGSKTPVFTQADLGKLRKFVLQGGTILSVTEFGGKEFSEAIRKTYKQMFPACKLKLLPKTHEIYSQKVCFDLPADKLKLEVISNGVRPLVIHTDADMTAHWQSGHYTTKESRPHFRMAYNIARYVYGQLRNLPKRGVSHWPEKKNVATTRTIQIARLRHGGNWNPEPLAFEALAMKMKNRAGIKLVVNSPINIAQLPQSGVKLAMMTGTDAVKFSDAEKAAIKSFVEGGGTVLIDVAGGNGRYGGAKPFARSIRDALKEIFPGRRNKPRQLASMSPLYAMEGYKIKTVRFRQHTRLMIAERYPQVMAIMVNGRPGILLSEFDLTAGLVGYRSLTIDGYTPDSTFKIVRNIILYANK